MTNSGPGSQVASRDVLNQVLKDESVLVQRSRDHQQAGSAARADPHQTEGKTDRLGPASAIPPVRFPVCPPCKPRAAARPPPRSPGASTPLSSRACQTVPQETRLQRVTSSPQPPMSRPHAPFPHFSSKPWLPGLPRPSSQASLAALCTWLCAQGTSSFPPITSQPEWWL